MADHQFRIKLGYSAAYVAAVTKPPNLTESGIVIQINRRAFLQVADQCLRANIRQTMRHPDTTSTPIPIYRSFLQPVHALLQAQMRNGQRQHKSGTNELYAIE